MPSCEIIDVLIGQLLWRPGQMSRFQLDIGTGSSYSATLNEANLFQMVLRHPARGCRSGWPPLRSMVRRLSPGIRCLGALRMLKTQRSGAFSVRPTSCHSHLRFVANGLSRLHSMVHCARALAVSMCAATLVGCRIDLSLPLRCSIHIPASPCSTCCASSSMF